MLYVLKVIIPIIYYQGKKEWELRQLSSLFDSLPENIKYYLPTMQHIFISLNRIEEGQIETIRDAMMAAAVMAQKWRINPVKLAEDFKNIFELFPSEGLDMNFFEMIVVYL
ncbi:MAG: Rpn family recombination-promoting nuclease/putative transposase [Saprospiraceae bacterium]|nr:Rpn family recombination-promoting nuclease/putative transposase [Saprospiraceae bacterium]